MSLLGSDRLWRDASVPGGRLATEGHGGGSDYLATFNANLAAADTILLPEGSFGLSGPLVVPAGKAVVGLGPKAEIKPLAGYTASHAVRLASGCALRGVRIDGTNLPAPAGAWGGGSDFPIGTAVGIPGSSGARPTDVRVEGCEFVNTPSGAVFAWYPTRLRVRRCHAAGVQTYVGAETGGVFDSYNGNDGAYEDCSINGFNWKGFVWGNGARNKGSRCPATGGVAGHAAHYATGGSDNGYVDCTQSGGFGFKAFEGERPYCDNYTSDGSANTGLMFEGCFNFRAANPTVTNPTNYGILVQSDSGFPGLDGGIISNPRIAWTGTPVSTNVGIYLLGNGNSLSNVQVLGGSIRKPYWGVYAPTAAGTLYQGIVLRGLKIILPAQYGVIAYPHGMTIEDCEIEAQAGVESGIFLAGRAGLAGAHLKVRRNKITGMPSAKNSIDICPGSQVAQWDLVDVSENEIRGGAQAILVKANNSTTDYMKDVRIDRNDCVGQSGTNAIQYVPNATTASTLSCTGSRAVTTAGVKKTIELTGQGAIVAGSVVVADNIATVANAPT